LYTRDPNPNMTMYHVGMHVADPMIRAFHQCDRYLIPRICYVININFKILYSDWLTSGP
jgi:hypothetical protein